MRRAAALVAALSLATPSARAAGPLPPDGEAITTSNYAVDLSPGAVLASTRVTGLSGAYPAIADGADGHIQNPASTAVRLPWSVDHFDYDWGFGITFPGSLANSDFFNSGRGRTRVSGGSEDFVFLRLAGQLQFGEWGFGATVEGQRYELQRAGGSDLEGIEASVGTTHLLMGKNFFDYQLVVGAGLRALALTVEEVSGNGQTRDLFTTQGAGFVAGALWKPNDEMYRLGIAFRSQVDSSADPNSRISPDANGDLFIPGPDPLYLPKRVVAPWDLNAGLALMFGNRPFNRRFIHPDERTAKLRRAGAATRTASDDGDEALEAAEERARQQLVQRWLDTPRFYVLVTMSLLVTGAVDEAVGVESFLERRVQRKGLAPVVSPRLGVESEVVPHWLVLRAGTYGEPARLEGAADRLHATMGFDAKLFEWDVFGAFEEWTAWRASGTLDVARDYLGWSLGAGFWY